MIILHIAAIKDDPFNGICVVVPQHVRAQQNIASVALMNINPIQFGNITTQFIYNSPFILVDLPKPFCKPDIVVFHEIYRLHYYNISNNLRKYGVPYIIIPHGELTKEAQHKKWLKKRIANLILFNRFITGAVAIQCLSEKELENTHFGKKKFVGTNGVLIPESKKEFFSYKGVHFVYIGRLESYIKGLDLMLEAFRLKSDFIRKNHCILRLYGPDINGRFAYIESMIKKKEISDFVSLNHEIIGNKKIEKLLNSDIFIQTSRTEGMPLGILEAMSYGIPCLVTKGTNLSEKIETFNAGWVAETNAESIASQIEQVVTEKEKWLSKSENAIALIQKEFTWEKVTKQIIDKYNYYTI